MIRRILVALDGSPRAPHVFDAAVEIATAFKAALIPLRAIDVPPEFPAAGAGSKHDNLEGKLASDAAAELSKITARAKDLLVVPPLVVAGQAWRVIVEQSEAHDADLIVIGSHGYGGLDRLLGTTAGKVANHATRNVLVVHARDGIA